MFFDYSMAPLVREVDNNDPQAWKELGPFVVDEDFSFLPVREGFERYGVRIHFDADRKPTAIYEYVRKSLVKPGDPAWEHAKYVAKQVTFYIVTSREHLLKTHILISNIVTRESMLNLPPAHPVRRLLGVFSFRSNIINSGAVSLTQRNSILHRASSLTVDSHEGIFDLHFKASNIFKPFPQWSFGPKLKALAAVGKYPFYSEGMALYKVFDDFVAEWFNASGEAVEDQYTREFYDEVRQATVGMAYELPPFSRQNLRDLLAQFIWCVTAYHEQVGTVVDYTRSPRFMGLSAVEGDDVTLVDINSYLVTAIATALTGLKVPKLMSKFENYFGVGGAPQWEREHWDKL